MNNALIMGLVLFLIVQAPIVFSINCDHYDSYEECMAAYLSELQHQDCSIFNFADCISEKVFDFFMTIVNAPLIPLLSIIQSLLTEPVDISTFSSLWAIMLYIISMFYGFLMLYAGFNFMLSGDNAVKRANAKEWLKNIFLIIVLVQASFYLYSIVVSIGSLMSLGVVNLIDQHFFMITLDNISNIGLEFFFGSCYVAMLFSAVVILALRYIIVAAGVAITPLAVFCYFIPPLKSYGKLMLNFLGTNIFITFLDAIVLLVCSKVVAISIFADYKILVMIAAFMVVNIMMFYFMFFSAIKSALSTGLKGVGLIKVISSIGKWIG